LKGSCYKWKSHKTIKGALPVSITLRQICLVAKDLAAVTADFEAVFGLNVCFRDEGVATFGLENALLPIGTNLLEIVAPTRKGTAGGRYLDRRGGDGGYMVITQASSTKVQDAAKARADKLGIRIAWERAWDTDGKPGNFLQFHPADTGGAFFELDWNAPNDPLGYWPPAGGDGWQDKINRAVIGDFVGVELQGDDPAAMAQKWSGLTGLDLGESESGYKTLTLANASLRFVKAEDGRGDGLGGLDVSAIDPEKAFAAARDQNLKVDGNQITICGTRFNLI
jgi:glyoxalase-like protein